MTLAHPSIAWLIPCRNEERTIAAVVADIKRDCPGAAIYVYDNASTDRTAEVARAAGATVRTERMRGKGNVVHRMFQDVDADLYLLIDGDQTYSVRDWRALASPVMAGDADMTVGSRLASRDPQAFRRFHHFGNRLITGLIRTLFRAEIGDVLSGYRAFNRRFVKSVGVEAFGFEIEVELTIKALERRFRIVEVELAYGERPEGSRSKLRTFEDGLIIVFTILRLFKDLKPLSLGLAFAALATAGAGAAFVLGHVIVGYFLLNAAMSAAFAGLILNSVAQRAKETAQVLAKLCIRAADDFPSEVEGRDSHKRSA